MPAEVTQPTGVAHPVRILIRLKEGYGFGDGIQMSVVLKHLQKYRPNWEVHYECRNGSHHPAIGLCHAVYTYDEPATGKFDQVIEFTPFDALYNFDDRPNTKVTSTLHEVFGLPWDEELGRVHINVTPMARKLAKRLVPAPEEPFVLLHYQGYSSGHLKDLNHWQAKDICDGILASGATPLVLDHHYRSTLDKTKYTHIRPDGADQLVAVIELSKGLIGIDSGAAHAAAATETPSIICWTMHHPSHYIDPAPNLLHLVPYNQRSLPPANDDNVFSFFTSHYRYTTYLGEEGLVAGVYKWLAGILNLGVRAEIQLPPTTFVVLDDKTSVAICLPKMLAIAQGRPIHVIVDTADRGSEVVAWLRGVPFIRKVMTQVIGLQPMDKPVNTRGQRIFSASGRDCDGRFRLVPDSFIEAGRPLSEWLPEYPCNEYDNPPH